ncbi:GTP-binding protein LepA [Cryptococcus sp. DSM 104549]
MSALLRIGKPCRACIRQKRALRSASAVLPSSIAGPSTPCNLRDLKDASARPTARRIPGARTFATSTVARAKATVKPVVEAAGRKRKVDMAQFPPERIRNLSIIAHIDHGKSTLADRLLQMTGTVPETSSPQFLDKLKVERERGITVKAQTVSIIHKHTDGHKYLINLIDTPGHVDFSYEVSRSLGACEGALLLVDCSQGIQAQTLSVFHHALEADLSMLAVINKVDLPHASPDETSEEIASSLGLPKDRHMRISAKSGMGVDAVLSRIVDGLPPPGQWVGGDDGKLRGLIFDTFYDHFRGVVSLVRILSGSLKKGDKVRFLQANKKYEILEVGINNPDEVLVDELKDGQVGYIVCSMKNSEEAFIGDTVCWADKPVEPLPGFKPMKAMVYAGIFPIDSADFPKLEEAIERLTLNDRSVSIQRESSAALSQGYRLGFLGTLHMDVFRQRLEDEYDSEVIVTAPTVPYKVVYHDGREEYISNPVEFPEVQDPKSRVVRVEEPMINATIFVPSEYIGAMMDLCARYRGIQQEYRVLENSDRAVLRYTLPLAEIVTDFFSELKSQSSGFASFDYEEAGYEESSLVKMNILVNARPVDALAVIVHRAVAADVGKVWVKKLKDVVPRQNFECAIQASIGHKVVARENVKAFRKDVTAGLYGGHYDRKLKHLNKQKEGKKKMRSLAGNIEIPQEAFYKVLSSRARGFATSARSGLGLGMGSGAVQVMPPFMVGRGGGGPVKSAVRFPPLAVWNDPVSSHLPSIPTPPPPSSDEPPPLRRAIAPLPHHTVPPTNRSASLSHLSRLTTLTAPSSVLSPILQTYTDLYLAAPHLSLFTVPEVKNALRAVRALQAREGSGDKQLAQSQLMNLMEELQNLLGEEDAKRAMGWEIVLLAGQTTWVRRVTPKDLERTEKVFEKLWPEGQVPKTGRTAEGRRYRACVNMVMRMYALAGDEYNVAHWWDKLERVQEDLDTGVNPDASVFGGSTVEPREAIGTDGYSWMARLILAENTGQLDALSDLLGVALASDLSRSGSVPLVNFAMAAYARAGRWDVVTDTYAVFKTREVEDLRTIASAAVSSRRSPALPLPPAEELELTRDIYSMLIYAAAAQGHLPAALTFFKHMLEDGHSPTVSDYMRFFDGFLYHGEEPKHGTGEVGRLLDVGDAKYLRSNNGLQAEGSERLSFEERMSDIWQRGTFASTPSATAHAEAAAEAAVQAQAEGSTGWTYPTLASIFTSFLTVRPTLPDPVLLSPFENPTAGQKEAWRQTRAPSGKDMRTILRAWAKVTGDERMVRYAWDEMEKKFGEGGEAEWKMWRRNGQLRYWRRELYGDEGASVGDK